jgi:hypothetical protein
VELHVANGECRAYMLFEELWVDGEEEGELDQNAEQRKVRSEEMWDLDEGVVQN